MALTLDQVRHVAALARLSLSEDEERRLQHQLSAILDAMALLETVDTSQVEPTSHAIDAQALRADEPRPPLGADAAIANAPVKVGTQFAVPKIIE